ncbi:MAG TPA: folate-binding protein [Acidocella sp.]|nr:folate-binding protein [Acidocella sp.]
MPSLAHLADRGVISVAGADRVTFLNGLVSNDAARAAPGQAVWAALLTAQGRYVTDFFIMADDDRLLLDTPRAAVADLLTRLKRFKLRAAVELADLSEQFHVYAAWDGMPPPVPITSPDPRLPQAGFRSLSEQVLETTATAQDYAAHRLSLGLPDGPPDFEADKTLLLEAGFDELGGIAWDKGCYMGQELTARTKYRGLIKRRLVPVVLSEAAPPPGTPILAEGVEVGSLRSSAGLLALASLRLDALQKPLRAGNALVSVRIPPWMHLPE